MRIVCNRLFVCFVFAGVIAGCSAAPSTEMVSKALKPIMPTNFAVKSIEKFSALNGVYEVVVAIDNQPTVLYLDSKLKHVISGSIVEIATKKNLTYETQIKNKPAVQSLQAVPKPPAQDQKAK